MDKKGLKERVMELMELHMPLYMEEEYYIENIVDVVLEKESISRRNIIIMVYMIGASVEETNELLLQCGYNPLYVKNREDAIWRHVIRKKQDLRTIMEYIFLPNNGDL